MGRGEGGFSSSRGPFHCSDSALATAGEYLFTFASESCQAESMPPDEHPRYRHAAWALGLLTALNLFNFIDRYVLPGVQPLVQHEFHATDERMGALTYAFFITYMLAAPLTGWLGDRAPRKPLVVAGAVLWSVATLLTATVHSYGQLYFRHAVVGIGEATFSVFAPAMIADMYPERIRNKVLSTFYLSIPVGAALGYLMAGQLGSSYGWRMPFLASAVPGLLIAVLILFFVREPQRGSPTVCRLRLRARPSAACSPTPPSGRRAWAWRCWCSPWAASRCGFPRSSGVYDTYGADAPRVHVVEGEGGLTAGRVAEALAAAGTGSLGNVVLHVDWNQASIDSNRVCRDGETPGDYVQSTPAELAYLHDWNVIEVDDGFSFQQIFAAQRAALALDNGQPTAIVYRTVKGWKYGIEGRASHGAGHPLCSAGFHGSVAELIGGRTVAFRHCDDGAQRCGAGASPALVESCYWDALLVVREALELRRPVVEALAARLKDARARLAKRARRKRPACRSWRRRSPRRRRRQAKQCRRHYEFQHPPRSRCATRSRSRCSISTGSRAALSWSPPPICSARPA